MPFMKYDILLMWNGLHYLTKLMVTASLPPMLLASTLIGTLAFWNLLTLSLYITGDIIIAYVYIVPYCLLYQLSFNMYI
jgi:hypothetical protein